METRKSFSLSNVKWWMWSIVILLFLLGVYHKDKPPVVEETHTGPIMEIPPDPVFDSAAVVREAVEKLDREISDIENAEGAESRHSKDEVYALAKMFGDKAIIAESYLKGIDTSISNRAAKLKKLLIARQKKDFPILRKNYIKWADAKAWENDMEIRGRGTTIEYVWGRFASNKNIKEFQDNSHDLLTKLRFKRAIYKWYKGQDDYTYYDMDSKGDGEL
jgi:hypothetical protein